MNSSVKSLAVVIVSGLLVTGLPVGAPPASSTGVSQLGQEIDGEAPGAELGTSVSMSADGSRMAVGSPAHDSSKGHVRVFDWDGSEWTQVGPDIDGEVGDDELGTSVSLSNDGSRVAIGAPGHDSDRGHVRVYEYDSDNDAWDKLGGDIDGEEQGDKSGLSVSLSSDGSRVAIGAPSNDGAGDSGSEAGHVRVYEYDSVNEAWGKLGGDIDGEETGSKSGFSVSLSADGSRVAIGAPLDAGPDDGILRVSAGHVRVYDLIGTTWTQVGSNIDGEAGAGGAGTSVSLSADGSLVAVGIPFSAAVGKPSTEEGMVRVYRNDGVTGDGDGIDGWTQLGSDMDGDIAQERFGFAVSLSADGSRVAIGAVRNDGNGGNLSHVGSVTVYDWNGSMWSQLGSDIDGEKANDEFGSSVALSSDGYRVAVGSGYRAAPGLFDGDGTGGSEANEGKVRAFSLPAAVTPPAPARNDDDDDDDDTVAAVEAPAPSAAERTPLPPGIADGAALRSSFRGGPPRNPRVSVGGVPTVVEKTFPNSQTLTVVAGGSFVLAVSVDEGSGGFASSDDDTQFIVKAGSTGVLQGYGLRPGASVKVSIPLSADESRELGSITVGADGTFSGDLPISADPLAVPTPLGVHSLQLVSVDPDGNQVVFEMAVTVMQGDPAPALDRASGLLPTIEPGSSEVTSAGVETEVTTTRLSDRGLDPPDAPWFGTTVFEQRDWSMSVAYRRYLSDIREEVREPRELYDPVEISGSGFVESTRADVWLFSEPILLGSVTVDDSGEFLVEVDIDPDVIPAGEHTLQIQGVGSDGYVKAVNLGVVVEQTVSQPAEVTTQSATGLLWWVLGLFLAALFVVLFFLIARSRSRRSA